MAPEQLLGQGADHRADQYSFCVALYQGLYGELPFKAQSIEALVREVSQGKPPEAVSSQVPARLRRAVLRGLRAQRADRYPSMDALLDELVLQATRTRRRFLAVALLVVGALAAVGGIVWKKRDAVQTSVQSIAVLPLADFSGDPEPDYFADGMTDELIADLAKVRTLRVISRTSMMRYKGTRKPLREIAQELNVDGVVEGSVRREGQRVRVTARLIHARTEKHLWGESFERDVQDVLTLQNDVARAIAKSIRALLTSDEKVRLGTTRQINQQAYEAYLKGLFHWNKATPEGAKKSSEYFEQVIQIDPKYAPAYARLALSHTLLAALRPEEPPMEIYPKAQAAALKALELDPTSADAHAALAVVRYKGQWNWAEAEKEFKTALELDSNSSTAHVAYGNFLETMARFDEAIAELKRAEELDPLSVVNMVVLGATYLSVRQYALATKEAHKALDIDPNFVRAHVSLGTIHLAQGNYDEAMSEFTKANELLGRKYSVGPLTHAMMGNRVEALKLLTPFESGELRQRYLPRTSIAATYALLGEKDKAFDWLEKAYQNHDQDCIYLKSDPIFDPLRSDPRFPNLLRRIGLPP